MTEAPRYRLREIDQVNSMAERAGYEFTFLGWPRPTYEPLNDAAAKISAYMDKHRFDAGKPETPRTWGDYYLPAFTEVGEVRSVEELLPVKGGWKLFRGEVYKPLPRDELPGMPRYTLTNPARFANVRKDVGDTVAYLGWPLGTSLEAANDEARSVVAYLREWGKHPKLPPAPWCDFKERIDLPDVSVVPALVTDWRATPAVPSPATTPRAKSNPYAA
jgi:hypothetical protein